MLLFVEFGNTIGMRLKEKDLALAKIALACAVEQSGNFKITKRLLLSLRKRKIKDLFVNLNHFSFAMQIALFQK